MAKAVILCGAKTIDGGTCRNRVTKRGARCHRHGGKSQIAKPPRKPLSPKRIIPLCFKVIEKVAALGGAAAAFERVYPTVLSLIDQLSGLLMPEHFWYFGFKPKDEKQMRHQIQLAHKKVKRLEEKYSSYTHADKLAIERVYRAILKTIEEHE